MKLDTSGGNGADGVDFQFQNLLPGTPQTATVHYTTTGTGNEDVYLVFPDAKALHAVDNWAPTARCTSSRTAPRSSRRRT